jgi:hypothetical protein
MAVLAHNLDNARHAIWLAWPGTVVGWVGDQSHAAGRSDHNPDSRGIVHAIDPMVTGEKAEAVVRAAVGRSDVEYVIHNRTIWSRNYSWSARQYTGSDPHTDHVHVSGKHGNVGGDSDTESGYDMAAENDNTPWVLALGTSTPPPPPSGSHAPGTRVLRYVPGHADMTGEDVRFVQRFIGSAHCGAADGDYGPNTARGVSWYEGMRGIKRESPYGEVGPQVFANMGVAWRG